MGERHYLRTHWPTLCDEVAKLRMELPGCYQVATRNAGEGMDRLVSPRNKELSLVPEEGIEPS